MALRPLRTYVRLNRQTGAMPDNRFDDSNLYQLIIPIKLKNGSFVAPSNDIPHDFFMESIKEGKTILINENGISWNFLCPTDRIIEMFQK
jgi:hypothetical protein